MAKYKEEIQNLETEIYKIMLDSKYNKYEIIPYIARWASELKYKEETKDLLDSERINKAVSDVLTGKITVEEIKKLPPLSIRKKLSIVETKETTNGQNPGSKPDREEKKVKRTKSKNEQ